MAAERQKLTLSRHPKQLAFLITVQKNVKQTRDMMFDKSVFVKKIEWQKSSIKD